MHQEQTNRNVGNYPGDTTTKNGGKQHSEPDIQTRTVTVFSCRIFNPNNNKPLKGNHARFPQELTGPHS